jgi:hypothetical protein
MRLNIKHLAYNKNNQPMNNIFKTRCAAIILIAAGYGWAGGHYIPADSNITAYLFQFIVLGILLWLAIGFFSMIETERHKRSWAVNGLTIFSALSFLINIGNIIHGALNHDPRAFGSHNTLADLVPILIILAGTALWLITALQFKRPLNN